MEYLYPAPDPFSLRDLLMILTHLVLGLLAFSPLIILLFQRKRPARYSDEWLFLLFVLIPPVVFLPVSTTFSWSDRQFVLGYLLLLEVMAIISLVVCQRRLQYEGMTTVAVSVLATVCVAGFLVLLMQPDMGPRGPSNRSRCANNLKQLGLGVYHFAETKKHYPFALGDPENEENVSWRVAITPYIEYQSIEEKYRFDEPWNSPANDEFAKMELWAYSCPMVNNPTDDQGNYLSSYSMPIGKNTFFGDGKTRIAWNEDSESQSTTIMLVEATGQHIPWTQPRDVNADELPIGINLPGRKTGWSNGLISSLHKTSEGSGAQVTFLDGAVYFLPKDTDPDFLEALLAGKLNEAQTEEFEKKYR